MLSSCIRLFRVKTMDNISGIQIESSMRRTGKHSIGFTVRELVHRLQTSMFSDFNVQIPDFPDEDIVWERRFKDCSRVILQFHPHRVTQKLLQSELIVAAVTDVGRGPTSRIFNHTVHTDPTTTDGPLAREGYERIAWDMTPTLTRLYFSPGRHERRLQEIYRARLMHDPLHVEPIYRQGTEQSLASALAKVLGSPSLTIELTDEYFSIYHANNCMEPRGYRFVIGHYHPEHGADTLQTINRL